MSSCDDCQCAACANLKCPSPCKASLPCDNPVTRCATYIPPMRPYSVLLLYPDYMDNASEGRETYYAHVTARDYAGAVIEAQYQASQAQDPPVEVATDFYPLLVVVGHHDPAVPWAKNQMEAEYED